MYILQAAAQYSARGLNNQIHEFSTYTHRITGMIQRREYNIIYKIQKHFQNVMLVGMASEISKNYTYKCVDRSRHNGIKGAKAKCAH